MYKILFRKSADKELLQLPQTTQERIAKAISELQEKGLASSQIKRLKDPLSGFRKRIGDYRILFDIQDSCIIISRIGKRAEAYR